MENMFEKIDRYRKIGSKIFLFIPDFENYRELFREVCREYMKWSFVSGPATLLIIVDSLEDYFNYVFEWKNAFVTGCCSIDYIEKGQVDICACMQHIDCYIAGMGRNSLTYINYAYTQNVRIISMYGGKKFDTFPRNHLKVNKCKEFEKIISNQLINNFPFSEYEYILFHQGLGETIAFFYSLREYRRRHKKRLLVLCFDKSRVDILEESPYIDSVACISPILYDYIDIYLGEKYQIKNFLRMWFNPDFRAYKISPFECIERYTETVQKVLGMDGGPYFDKYPVRLPDRKTNHAKSIFKQMNLRKEKTVFLVMDGLSLGGAGLSLDFWKRLVQLIQSAGYDVVIKGNSEIIGGIPYVFLPPVETAAFAGMCGNVIGVGSGILAAIGIFNFENRLQIQQMYPDEQQDNIWKNNIGSKWVNVLPTLQYYGEPFVKAESQLDKEFYSRYFCKNTKLKTYILQVNEDKEKLLHCMVQNLNSLS